MIPIFNRTSAKAGKTRLVLGMTVLLALAGCSDDDNPLPEPPVAPEPAPAPPTPPAPVTSSYDITVTNLTNAQPLSPVAVVLHTEGQLWEIGASASEELEYLAEGGDNSFVLGLPVAAAGASGMGPIGPGASETISISIDVTDMTENDSALLSVVTMLVNTNDAFTGINAQSLAALEPGQSWSTRTHVYDSGTEANSEAQGTIPGPVDGGAGFDAARDDVNYVAMHPGVVSMQDGLATSVLTKQHGFDNPAAKITVTRTE